MSDPKEFLSRWSRRKLDPEIAKSAPASPATGKDAAPPPAPAPEFDITSLPSLESIGANSDIRAFLQRGVPQSLTRAALRRAWSADPAIRDFVGLSENSWDFNAPDSMPGFGPLNADEVRQAAARFFGAPSEPVQETQEQVPTQQISGTGESDGLPPPETQAAAPGDPSSDAEENDPETKKPVDWVRQADASANAGQQQADVAMQHQEQSPPDDSMAQPRRHGGAIPK